MIKYYSGTPGSGKSLDCARIIINRLHSNKCVTIGNFPINLDNVKGKIRGHYLYIDNEFLTPERLVNFSRNYSSYLGRPLREDEVLVIIDEAQLIFNAREWGNSDRKQWLWFFTQHRKLGYSFILCSQFDRQIDRQIRALFEYEFRHRKVSNYGKWGKLLRILLLGELFVCVRIWYPMNEKLDSVFFRSHKKLYSIYDTNMIFNSQYYQ